MPLVEHSTLPSFAALRAAGETVLTRDQAVHQDIRELHVGLCNAMPDAALRATEQQFLRLVGGANQIVQVIVHPFSLPGIERGPEARAYVETHYEPLDQLQRDGLDALVITGANVARPDLAEEPFWEPLGELVAWADEHVTSTLCSCLSTHALLQRRHGVRRRRMLEKRWGVFGHRVVDPTHPLVRGTNTRFDAPHSRWNTIMPDRLRAAGVRVLAETVDGGFHLGTSPDGFRTVYFQGHPEYDTVSLLKEYRRELERYLAGELEGSPPHPTGYLSASATRLVNRHLEQAVAARDAGRRPPPLPEEQVLAELDNTWADTGRAIFANWLGLVYQLTDLVRGRPLMDDVDPDDPLGLGPPQPPAPHPHDPVGHEPSAHLDQSTNDQEHADA